MNAVELSRNVFLRVGGMMPGIRVMMCGWVGSDVLDCRWLQRLHSYGLLSGSFRPAERIVVLPSYLRQRPLNRTELCRPNSSFPDAIEVFRSPNIDALALEDERATEFLQLV